MRTLLEKIRQVRVLVVGDIMLDRYLWGDADRLSPEAPVPVVKITRETFTLGGAANVASNLHALGASVELSGKVGQDDDGRRLSAMIAEKHLNFDARMMRPDCRTIVKTRIMCRRQQICRADLEDAPSRYAWPSEILDHVLVKQLANAHAVILSDYAKGVITSEIIQFVQAHVRPGTLIALDPKPRPELTFSGVGLMTPNRAEAQQLAGLQGIATRMPSAEEMACIIQERYHPNTLIVTLGADGMLVCPKGQPGYRIATAAREVFDVSGAGDTVIAVLTAALAAGGTLNDAVTLANLAAGVVVGKIGTATATPDEILAHAGSQPA